MTSQTYENFLIQDSGEVYTQLGETPKQGSVPAASLAPLHTNSVNRLFINRENGVIYGDMKLKLLLFQDDISKIVTLLKLSTMQIMYTLALEKYTA